LDRRAVLHHTEQHVLVRSEDPKQAVLRDVWMLVLRDVGWRSLIESMQKLLDRLLLVELARKELARRVDLDTGRIRAGSKAPTSSRTVSHEVPFKPASFPSTKAAFQSGKIWSLTNHTKKVVK
jgi:hypothetical protein